MAICIVVLVKTETTISIDAKKSNNLNYKFLLICI